MPALLESDLDAYLPRFGLSSFRPGQRDVIAAVMGGSDCLCIMPTGGGKSLCYQLPSLARDGLTLVVSPLIALMKDQVDALRKLNIRATYVNSSLALNEQRQRLEQMSRGEYDLVYVAPERLRNPRFLDAVRQAKLRLLAVDEAHCISEWGHDFRPDYARLGQFRQRLGRPTTIALTATATPKVREDIARQLDLREPRIFITGFARPNLRFEVQQPQTQRDKDEALTQFLAETDGAGIIYAATRKRCEELVETLSASLKRKVGLYHAGMLPDQRRRVQEEFMSGGVSIVVATNAFGMGIDKADLRFVVHYNMPGTLEAYYQEAGRAGRDGGASRCLLLYSVSDRYIQEFFIENAYPPREAIKRVYAYLRTLDDDPIEVTLQEFKERLELSIGAEGVGACLQILEKYGALERMDSRENMAAVRIDSELPTLVDLLPKEAKVRRKVLRAVERVVGEMRGERVYFHPRQLGAKIEQPWDSVQRALRELNRLEAFDYVPPFRGRAVHLLRRDTNFDNLGIDFEELDRRRAAEFEKLERVIRYARTPKCRQLLILEYFGDPSRAACQTCDNCRPAEQSSGAGQQYDGNDASVIEAVRIALSGVARMQQQFGERIQFGKQTVAQMLCGSKSSKMSKWKLDKLSTFGLLSPLTQIETISLLDALIQVDLIRQVHVEKKRPIVQLTPDGVEVMMGNHDLDVTFGLPRELVVKLRQLKRPPNKPRPAPAQQPAAPDVPRDAPPSTKDGKPHESDSPNEASSPPAVARRPAGAPQASYHWTWRLLADGYPYEQCRQIRGLDDETIVAHLLRASEDGLAVRPEWLFTPEQQSELEDVVTSNPDARIGDLARQLPAGLRLDHLQLFLKCRP